MDKHIVNWIKSSQYDLKTAEHMFKTGRYIYVLFMCHLSVEKLLKGLYEAVLKKVAPKTHNLIHLLNTTGVELPEKHLETLESLNALSIVTRYPEDIEAMVKAFKRKKAGDYLQKTKELLKWLKKDKRLKIS
ncbi:MAG: HEPN domain-containing protein [Nitrospirae bacterium]|nr:HEPN domain-containing protein [Nitrospirota bacterium]MCL5977334.1 HEPN domain-containing protein [Nitrospirota bacterium]